MADLIAAVAGLGTLLVAAGGLWFAYRQVAISRQMNAQDAYEAYHHLALQNPELALGDFDFSGASGVDRKRYSLFVLSMLLTVEKIVTLFPRDPQWLAAARDDIGRHISFILSDEFLDHRRSLDPLVNDLIDEVGVERITAELPTIKSAPVRGAA